MHYILKIQLLQRDYQVTEHVISLNESYIHHQDEPGWEKPDGCVPNNNCLTIIAYLAFQTMKMQITMSVMHQFVGLPVQLPNRLHPIHY